MNKHAMAMVLAVAALAAGCMDREQEARRVGEQARGAAADACRTRAPEEKDECAALACAPACARFADADVFRRACVAACVANAECATDTDCGEGLRCVAIAPRVRRCAPRVDAGVAP